MFDCFTCMPPNRSCVQPFVCSRSENTILLHVPSQEQVKELFLIGNLNPAKFQTTSELLFCMCGKLHIRYPQNNETEVAYVLRQHRTILHKLIESDTVSTCTKLTYCTTNTNAYLVDIVTDRQVTNS